MACLHGLLAGVLMNSPLPARENSPLPRYSWTPPLVGTESASERPCDWALLGVKALFACLVGGTW